MVAMVAVASVALPQKQKIKPTWQQQHMVTCLLGGAKNENSQPSHGSGGIPTATSLWMPPPSRH